MKIPPNCFIESCLTWIGQDDSKPFVEVTWYIQLNNNSPMVYNPLGSTQNKVRQGYASLWPYLAQEVKEKQVGILL
jgi:hypothetical protein